MNPCRGIFGWLFGHKFEERNDEHHEELPWTPSADVVYANRLAMLRECNPPHSAPTVDDYKYIHDICVRCGTTVARPPEIKS